MAVATWAGAGSAAPMLPMGSVAVDGAFMLGLTTRRTVRREVARTFAEHSNVPARGSVWDSLWTACALQPRALQPKFAPRFARRSLLALGEQMITR